MFLIILVDLFIATKSCHYTTYKQNTLEAHTKVPLNNLQL